MRRLLSRWLCMRPPGLRVEMTTRTCVAMAALMLVLGAATTTRPGFSQPAEQPEHELESRIVNVNGELIQLGDGTVVRVPHGLALQTDLREGRRVKVIYELKDGKPVAKSIKFLEEAKPGVRK